MSQLLRSLLGLLALALLATRLCAAQDLTYVPPQLNDWVPWVLEKHPEQTCPFQTNGKDQVCNAPSSLRLVLEEGGGTFELQGYAFKEGWVPLPGDALHWPQAVLLDGSPVAVGTQQDKPALWLPAGAYALKGEFRWTDLPELFHIPAQTGLIDLTVNGEPQARIGRPQPDSIWVGRQGAAEAGEADRLSLSVFRRITDAVPMEVTTLYRIEVAGTQREVELPAPLLDGFTPTRVQSALPMRLDNNAGFQLQVRPGVWEVSVTGRSGASREQLSAPVFADTANWPDSEIWVFEARPAMRLVEVTGVPSIDPTQVPLPEGWQAMPTYRLSPGEALSFAVKRRGDPEPEANQLNLARTLWLDFSGEGYTIRDQIGGSVSQGWRLDALPETQLGYAQLNGRPQLITRLSEGSPAGVELRQGNIELFAESRTPRTAGGFAALGWDHPFQSVRATLNLPPGWKLFSVSGVDNIPGSWLQRWTLFDLFLVLVTAVAAARLWNWRWGAMFLVTLTLLWHESGAPQWTWINLIAVIALLRVVGDIRRLRRSLEIYRALTAAALILLLIPFSVDQIRTSIYPQLERPHQAIRGDGVQSPPEAARLGRAEPEEIRLQEFASDMAAPAKSLVSQSAAKRYRYNLESFDPGAKLQTGPGLPQWQWNSVQLAWNGPVQPQQVVELIYIPPMLNSVLNWLRVALALLLAWHLLRGMIPAKLQQALPVGAAFLFVPLLTVAPAQDARADYPPPALLNELEQRLLQPPRCLPGCASIPRARLSVSDQDVLQLRIDVHASEAIAAPLPGRAGHWEPGLVTVDGELPPLTRSTDGTLYVALEPGIHTLVMQGSVAGANAVQLHFPLLPRQLDTAVEGWDVIGFRQPGVPTAQIQLTRLKPDDDETLAWEPVSVPPFVRLNRTLALGLDWEIRHQLVRVTPTGKSIVLHVPLLPGESVLDEDVQVRDGHARITLAPQQSSFSWLSRLDKQSPLVLQAADNDAWAEVWRFEVSPVWHVDYQGLPAVHHTDRNSRWLPSWHPWPGETLTATLTRPEGVPGPTVTIQSSSLSLKPGRRATDADLTLSVRSSQGSKRQLFLPEGAELLSVTIDGQAQPIRQEGREVILPLRPGTQAIDLKWRSPQAVAMITETPEVDLGGRHVNAALKMSLGQDRWILWTHGPAMGPAVLFWGVVIVIGLVAFILGRIKLTPLKTWQWALLGLGLSQVPLPLAGLVVAWFFVLAYRGCGDMPERPLAFNAIQIGLAFMTLLVVGAIILAVQTGLLGSPSMLISGNSSSAYVFNWYQDRWQAGYPQALVISVPLLVYRLLMLLWSLWLAFASVSWLRWGWAQYATGGVYRPRQRKSGKAGKRKWGRGEQAEASDTPATGTDEEKTE